MADHKWLGKRIKYWCVQSLNCWNYAPAELFFRFYSNGWLVVRMEKNRIISKVVSVITIISIYPYVLFPHPRCPIVIWSATDLPLGWNATHFRQMQATIKKHFSIHIQTIELCILTLGGGWEGNIREKNRLGWNGRRNIWEKHFTIKHLRDENEIKWTEVKSVRKRTEKASARW